MKYDLKELNLIVRDTPGLEKHMTLEQPEIPMNFNDGEVMVKVCRGKKFSPDSLTLPQRKVIWDHCFEKPYRLDPRPLHLGVVYPDGEEKLLKDMETHEVEDIQDCLFSGNTKEMSDYSLFLQKKKAKENPKELDVDHKIATVVMAEQQGEALFIAKRSNEISEDANKISQEANNISLTAIQKASRANLIAAVSIGASVISILVAIYAATKP